MLIVNNFTRRSIADFMFILYVCIREYFRLLAQQAMVIVSWLEDNSSICNVDDSTDKRLEDEVQRCRDLLDEANRQISSMSNSVR